MTVVVPPDRAVGEAGHVDDHHVVNAALTSLDSQVAAKLAVSVDAGVRDLTATSAETMPRAAAGTGATAVSGVIYWTCFTALQDMTVSQITMVSSTAGTSLTLCRMGLYTDDGSTLALVARTASDTSLFTGNNTGYTRSFDTTGGYPATYNLTAGSRYATALIHVGTGTAPTIVGTTAQAHLGPVGALLPRKMLTLTTQSDLVTSTSGASAGNRIQFARVS